VAGAQQRGDIVGPVAERPDLAQQVTQDGHVGRADDAQPAADGLPDADRERGGLHDPEPTVGDDERTADAGQALRVRDVDPHADGEEAPREVHELRITAERIDREPAVEPTAHEVDRRPERLGAVVLDQCGSHAASSPRRRGVTVPHS
jgi:hypothetical protein